MNDKAFISQRAQQIYYMYMFKLKRTSKATDLHIRAIINRNTLCASIHFLSNGKCRQDLLEVWKRLATKSVYILV